MALSCYLLEALTPQQPAVHQDKVMQDYETKPVAPPPPEPDSAADPAAERSRRSALLIVFLVVFIDLLGFGIVLPLLPIFGDNFLKDLVTGGKDSAYGGMVLGLLMSSF